MENYSLISRVEAIASAKYTFCMWDEFYLFYSVFFYISATLAVKLKKQQWVDALCMSLTSKQNWFAIFLESLMVFFFQVSPKNR